MSHNNTPNNIRRFLKKERLEELERWAQSSSEKVKKEANNHLNKIKSGRSTFIIGIVCPLLWWAIITKQSMPIILICIVHSVVYVIWGIHLMRKGYASLINMKEGL